MWRKRNRNKSRKWLKEEEKEKRGGNIKKGVEDKGSGDQWGDGEDREREEFAKKERESRGEEERIKDKEIRRKKVRNKWMGRRGTRSRGLRRTIRRSRKAGRGMWWGWNGKGRIKKRVIRKDWME
jgi:hypothetical protein